MGSVGGLLGINGGFNGTGIAAPQAAQITPGTNASQLAGSYGGAQNSLASQQALLAALQAQNGIGNQSQVFNQLQGVANGTGPNPAQAMLAQATGQNVANQAALMAGQRGAGANAGLIARQAGQTGAGIQQNAAGQAATLQANQALGALGAMGNLANTQAGQQIGATTANTQANQSEQQILQGANAQANNANVGMQGNINSANAQLASPVTQGQQGIAGGVLQGAGMALGLADGGAVPSANPSGPQSTFGKFMSGWAGQNASGPTSGPKFAMDTQGNGGAQALQTGTADFMKGAGSALGKLGSPAAAPLAGTPLAGGAMDAGAPVAAGMMASKGGKVPAMVSPGERYLPPQAAKEVAAGKKSALKASEKIPGKAKVAGDSTKNDTVPRMLEPGGVVVKRTAAMDENKAAKFVQAVLAKKARS